MAHSFFSASRNLLDKARQEPYHLFPAIFALINGYWHKLKFFLAGRHLKTGTLFRVYGSFKIIGPGKVVIGDNCALDGRLFGPVAFWTDSPLASIVVGNDVGLHGTSIQCFKEVVIGNKCMIADAYITDSSAHSLSADRRYSSQDEVAQKTVKIDNNVWVCTKAAILHGVTIVENCVIGACSLVRHEVPPNSFYAGNPAKFIKNIEGSGQ